MQLLLYFSILVFSEFISNIQKRSHFQVSQVAPASGGLLDGLVGQLDLSKLGVLGPLGDVLKEILDGKLLDELIRLIKECVLPLLKRTVSDPSKLTSLEEIVEKLLNSDSSLSITNL